MVLERGFVEKVLHGIRAQVIKEEQYTRRGDFKVLSFGPRVCKADLKISVQNFHKQITYLDSVKVPP